MVSLILLKKILTEIFICLLKYNTMVPKLNLKSMLTCEGKIHIKQSKEGSLMCTEYTMLNNSVGISSKVE